MSMAVGLVLYTGAVLMLGPAVLRALTRSGMSPRWGVAAWLAAMASVVSAWVVISVFVVIDEVAHWSRGHSMLDSCLDMLFQLLIGQSGQAPPLMHTIAAASVLAVTVVAVSRLVASFLRLRANACRHAHDVRLVGQLMEGNVVIVDADVCAAYCVAGRPSTVVVTRAATARLTERELAAVLAHEQAHVRGHHLEVSMVVGAAARAFPRCALMRDGAAEVTRLLEMCADEVAANCWGRHTLLTGLLTLTAAAPVAALGAADAAVLSRAQRLALPPTSAFQARLQAALAAITVIAVPSPVATLVLAGSGLFVCG